MPDPDLEIREGGGGGGGGLPKNVFRPFRPQFGLKIKGAAPRAPPLDRPLACRCGSGCSQSPQQGRFKAQA